MLTEQQLGILRVETAAFHALPQHPTCGECLTAIARLGGHIPTNGRPGWMVLARGLVHMLLIDAYVSRCRVLDTG